MYTYVRSMCLLGLCLPDSHTVVRVACMKKDVSERERHTNQVCFPFLKFSSVVKL